MTKKIILSHRGVCTKSICVENTLSIMIDTYNLIKNNDNFTIGFEFDIQLTKDNNFTK